MKILIMLLILVKLKIKKLFHNYYNIKIKYKIENKYYNNNMMI